MAVEVDKYTKLQATEYANNEAELLKFPIGSERWKRCFKEYLEFAKGTMSVGRNPRGRHKVETIEKLYPDILSKAGFAGKIAEKYQSQSGQGIPVDAIQNRILSSVTNLVKLFENGELGLKTTTKGHNQGRIENSDMSEFQLPIRPKEMTDEEYEAESKDVIRNWLVRDLLMNAVLESLMPFFKLTKSDVDDIMGLIKVQDATIKDIQGGEREIFVKRLRASISPRVAQISFRKLLLG